MTLSVTSGTRCCKLLQASGFRGDVTLFRVSAAAVGESGLEPAFGGIRRNAYTYSRRLITRRSQVQILPPLLKRPWKQSLLLQRFKRGLKTFAQLLPGFV